MDINAKIQWNPGMILSSAVMNNFIDNMENRRRVAVSATLVGRFGLMAGMPFNAKGFFVKGGMEIPSFRCTAILPSGAIIDASEDVRIDIPKLETGNYYLCVGVSDKLKKFENGDNVYVRAEYDFSLERLPDIEGKDLFPVMKLSVEEGTCRIDDRYIVPCIQMSGDSRLLEHRDHLVDILESTLAHPNFTDDIAKSNILGYLIHLRTLAAGNDTCSFMHMTAELAEVIDYFIAKPYGISDEETAPLRSIYDIAAWLEWLSGYLESANKTLDTVERKNREIDVEALKKEIAENVTASLRDELTDKLMSGMRPVIEKEIDDRLDALLKDYTDGTFRSQIHDSLMDELGEGLKTALYDSLYKALYDALYVPETKNEDNFMPMI